MAASSVVNDAAASTPFARLTMRILTMPLTGSRLRRRPCTGAGSAHRTVARAVGSPASLVELPSMSTNALSSSVPSRTPSQAIRATPAASVVTVPAPAFGPAIDQRIVAFAAGVPSLLRAVAVTTFASPGLRSALAGSSASAEGVGAPASTSRMRLLLVSAMR
ncbi:MAG: hypothetical protein QOJ12_175 [Thermoleophilales bacterium]|nr:hypothetical protein [Thermoleophilales bacterium]